MSAPRRRSRAKTMRPPVPLKSPSNHNVILSKGIRRDGSGGREQDGSGTAATPGETAIFMLCEFLSCFLARRLWSRRARASEVAVKSASGVLKACPATVLNASVKDSDPCADLDRVNKISAS